MGASPDGHPWIGAANPILEVQEFTDYQCPHCRRAHMMVRRLLSTAGDKVRVYHRHLPLDQACNPAIAQPFHNRACELSRVALCAQRQGRFWEMNDFLFQQADEIREKDLSPRDIAGRLELDLDAFACCLDEASTKEALAKDVAEGNDLGIKGTPAFVIGGQVNYGRIPAEALTAAGIAVP
jgi:protein-disulfide isomerase